MKARPQAACPLVFIIIPIVCAVRGTDDVGKVEQPLARREVLGVRLLGPEALEGDLILGLVAGAARIRDFVGRDHAAGLHLLADADRQTTHILSPDLSVETRIGVRLDL